MRTFPPGWATDLAVLEHSGSIVEDREDHLVVRTPHNPDFHWGNCLFVTDEDTVDDARRWVDTFQSAFPQATWVAIGLTRMPDDQDVWVALELELELDDVLTTRILPRQTPLPEGYTVRRLGGEDWAQSVARSVAKNDRTGEHDPRSFERFAQRQARARRALSERDIGASFGAFVDAKLIADLGIVRCGSTARYQASAPTTNTGGTGWPPTFSALPHSGPLMVAATVGSSLPRLRTRPAASTAALGSSQTPATPRRTASRLAKVAPPPSSRQPVDSDDFSDNAFICRRTRGADAHWPPATRLGLLLSARTSDFAAESDAAADVRTPTLS